MNTLGKQLLRKSMVGASGAGFGKACVNAKAASSQAAKAQRNSSGPDGKKPSSSRKDLAGKIASVPPQTREIVGVVTAVQEENDSEGLPPQIEQAAGVPDTEPVQPWIPPDQTTVNLSRRGLGASGLLGQLIAELSSSDRPVVVRSLNLLSNGLGTAGAAAFAGVLARSSSTLTELDLGRNELGDEGATSLASAMAKNASLLTLFLGGNGIRATGAASLASALQRNGTLLKLELGSNEIGDKGAQAFAETLSKHNMTLQDLGVGFNGIADHGADALASALKTNPTLTSLSVQVGFKAKGAAGNASLRAIEAKLKRNASKRIEQGGETHADAAGCSSLFAMAASAGSAQGEAGDSNEDDGCGDDEASSGATSQSQAQPRQRMRRQW